MDRLAQLLKIALSTVTNDEGATQSLLAEYWAANPAATTAAVVRWMYRQTTYTAIAESDSSEDQTATRPCEDAFWVGCTVVTNPNHAK